MTHPITGLGAMESHMGSSRGQDTFLREGIFRVSREGDTSSSNGEGVDSADFKGSGDFRGSRFSSCSNISDSPEGPTPFLSAAELMNAASFVVLYPYDSVPGMTFGTV